MSEEIKYYEATPEEKRALLKRLLSVLSRREEVLIAIIYGSFTRRRFFRDVDLAVYTGGSVEDPLRFESRLSLELSKVLGMRVDVKVVDEAPAWFRLKIAREGAVIYEKIPGIYSIFVKEAVGDFQDLKIKQAKT
ncbi:MAG: hypothetical protein DRJ59_06475 [Thermoprotei archaeon]|nr:MAG: hypothetical protein DRJ59_06475 [Thermoprotei archaeon]